MYLKSFLPTLLLAGLFSPLAPAKYLNADSYHYQPAALQVEKTSSEGIKPVTALTESDYTATNSDDQSDNDHDGVIGTDVVSAVWYHDPHDPVIFGDVAFHHHRHHRHYYRTHYRRHYHNDYRY